MHRYESQERMVEIEKMLMRLANECQGNADHFDAVVAAQTILHDAAYANPRA